MLLSKSILRLPWGRGNNENTLGSENISSASSKFKFQWQKKQMRIPKEVVVNLTINELIRNRVRKLEDDLLGHSEKKKSEILCEVYIKTESSQRTGRTF